MRLATTRNTFVVSGWSRRFARDATELAFGTDEESEDASDAIPTSSVQGRDLLNVAQGDHAYRTKGDGKKTVLTRPKGLYLGIRPAYVHSPEMQELARIFRLTPGLSIYKIKSELSEDVKRRLPSALGSDTIYVYMRSVLQIMTFLSKGVCVPEDHVRFGLAPMTLDEAGQPVDWTQVTAGNLVV